MSLKMILFDLDGTLLPMDQDKFVKVYLGLLAEKLSNYGYEPNKFIDSILKGITAMVENDGSQTNEEAFWDCFKNIYGDEVIKDHDKFEEFYKNEFQLVQHACGYMEKSGYTIKLLKKHGYKVALATNPLFPAIATESRMRWAGLKKEDFELVTTYENSKYCKPNLDYFIEILNKLNVKAEECLMVGNDVCEDMIANKLGMNVFLLPKYLINKNNEDINNYPNGNFDDLLIYIEEIKNSEQ